MDYNDLRFLIKQMHMHMRPIIILEVLLIEANECPWFLIVNDNARVARCCYVTSRSTYVVIIGSGNFLLCVGMSDFFLINLQYFVLS